MNEINSEWFLAAVEGNLEKLKLLSNENIGSIGVNNCTALMYSAAAGFIDCVKFLGNFKEEIQKQDIDGNTALIYATKANQILCVQYLRIFESNIYNNDEKDALFYAQEYNYEECIKLLLETNTNSKMQFAQLNNTYNNLKTATKTIENVKVVRSGGKR